jgi:hypothetical protein
LRPFAFAGAAAAGAGGGAATVAAADRDRPAVAATPAVRQVAQQQAPRAAVAGAPVVISVPRSTSSTSPPAPARERRIQPGAEFGLEQAAAPTARTSKSTTQAPSRAGGEFDLEP